MKEQLTLEDRRQQDSLATDLTRALLHLEIARTEVGQLHSYRMPEAVKRLNDIKPFAKELMGILVKCDRKIRWFTDTVKKMLGEANAKALERDLHPDSDKLANVAQVSEWVINTPGDLSNEVDLVVNTARRRDLMLRAWRTALGTPQLDEQDQMRFNAWYNANFPSASYRR